MVKEAEKFKEDDEKQKARIEAKNQLENFCYSVKNQLNEQFASNISKEDKKAIEDMTKEALDWMDAHQDATKEYYEAKMKEVKEKFCRHDFYEIKNLLIFKKNFKKALTNK